MAHQLFLLCLILVNALAGMASENAPARTPYKAEAPIIRKLGKHQGREVETYGSAPASSPSQAPQPEENMHPTGESPSNSDHSAASVEPTNGDHVSVEGQTIRLEKPPHHSIDKSIAGGGVILGGLATSFLVAVFCYIRATGRHKSESTHQCTTETTN